MPQCEEYKKLDQRLQEYCGKGVRSSFFKRVLMPSWWEPWMSENSNLTRSAAIQVGLRLRVNIAALFDSNVDFALPAPSLAYKHRQGDSNSTLAGPSAMLTALSGVVLSGFDSPEDKIPSALEVREIILRTAKTVDLYSLLDYCWDAGIPVMYVNDTFPKPQKSNIKTWHLPQAVTIASNGRHCIFLTEKQPFQARYLFTLAHELGHIALGHLSKDGCRTEMQLDEDACEPQEQKANTFALQLLNGCETELPLTSVGHPADLARWAVAIGEKRRIDPGHLILRHAFRCKRYSLCTKALQILNQTDKKHGNQPAELLRSKTFKFLPLENYTMEQQDHIGHVAGIEGFAL